MDRSLILFLLAIALAFQHPGSLNAQSYNFGQMEKNMEYYELTGRFYTNYQLKMKKIRTSLRQKINNNLDYKSLHGTTPEDTAWALTTINNKQKMSEIYAENRIEAKQEEHFADNAFRIENGQINFTIDQQKIPAHKAVPTQKSVIQILSTAYGPRIPATTRLTDEGLTIQAVQGCSGCHSI